MGNWQRVDTKIVYQNSYITVHEDSVITPDGKPTTYGWVETPPGVMVLAVDTQGRVILVKQLRYTTGQPSWELPGGSSDGQDPLEAAKIELEEEAGLHADKWIKLNGETYVWNAVATERNTILIAKSLHKAKTDHLQTDDVIDTVHAFTWVEIKQMIRTGELNDGQTITALMRAGLDLGHLK